MFKKRNAAQIAVFLLLFAAIVFVNAAILYRRWLFLSYYDSSPELKLAQILASEGSVFTKRWYYSTEIRVIQTQIINALLFRFTGNWRLVGAASMIIHACILELSYLFLVHTVYKKIPVGFLAAGLALVLPVSQVWRMYVVEWLFYIPHFAIVFLALSCFIRAIHPGRQILLWSGVLFAVLFLACLGGVRHIENTLLPLLLTAAAVAFLRKGDIGLKKACAVLCAVMLTGASAGYLLNARVLQKAYSFMQFNEIQYSFISFARLEEMINDILKNFGYACFKVLSMDGMLSLGALGLVALILFLLFKYQLKEKLEGAAGKGLSETVVTVFVVASWIVNFGILFLTNAQLEARYFLPTVGLLFVLLPVLLYNDSLLSPKMRRVIATLVCMFIGLAGICGYNEWNTLDRNNDALRALANDVSMEDYTIGYGKFYTANVLPALTNGKTDFYSISDFNNFTPFNWLTSTDLMSRKGSDEKAFIILDRNDYESIKDLEYIKGGEIKEYEDRYVIVKYPSNAKLWSCIEASRQGEINR